ncbi:MAG: GntR family transcriptional regulator [Synergistaceae bacterium]|jgi:predicted transcriptional regulator|nr:GntR family transcriptional regulator [Synergistaceae bacterium]
MLMKILDGMKAKLTILPQEIAAELGVSNETVSSALERLTQLGYLRAMRRNAENGGCDKCLGWGGKCCQWTCGDSREIKWYERNT